MRSQSTLQDTSRSGRTEFGSSLCHAAPNTSLKQGRAVTAMHASIDARNKKPSVYGRVASYLELLRTSKLSLPGSVNGRRCSHLRIAFESAVEYRRIHASRASGHAILSAAKDTKLSVRTPPAFGEQLKLCHNPRRPAGQPRSRRSLLRASQLPEIAVARNRILSLASQCPLGLSEPVDLASESRDRARSAAWSAALARDKAISQVIERLTSQPDLPNRFVKHSQRRSSLEVSQFRSSPRRRASATLRFECGSTAGRRPTPAFGTRSSVSSYPQFPARDADGAMQAAHLYRRFGARSTASCSRAIGRRHKKKVVAPFAAKLPMVGRKRSVMS